MSKYTIRFWPYTALDLRYAEKYLEKKAGKGLMFAAADINSFPIVWYEKTKPQAVKFYLDGYKCQNSMDTNDTPYDEYLEMARAAGWKHICAINDVQYFVSEENCSPVPLHTQVESEFEALRIPFKKSELPMSIAAVFLICFFGWFIQGELLKEAFNQFSVVTVLIGIAGVMVAELLRYLVFVIRGSKALPGRKDRQEIAGRKDRQEITGRQEEENRNEGRKVKIWGSIYNLSRLAIECAIILQIAFWAYQLSKEDGNNLDLYCGLVGSLSAFGAKGVHMPIQYNKDKSEKPHRIKGLSGLSLFFFHFFFQ